MYPTVRSFRSPPGAVFTLVSVGAANVESYQPNGTFQYTVCDPLRNPLTADEANRLPTGYDAARFNTLVRKWDELTVWQKSNGRNIIETLGVGSRTCQPPLGGVTRNQVAFYPNDYAAVYCNRDRPSACWLQTGNLSSPPSLATIMLNADGNWLAQVGGGCPAVEATLRHEVGHALGFNHTYNLDSLMEEMPVNHCVPTAWDAAAMMANYQSR